MAVYNFNPILRTTSKIQFLFEHFTLTLLIPQAEGSFQVKMSKLYWLQLCMWEFVFLFLLCLIINVDSLGLGVFR